MNRSGFTLIEVLLSLAIFTIIGIATAKHLSQVRNTKEIAFRDMEMYNAGRTAISILRNDLRQAFHILYDDLGKETKQAILQAVGDVPHTIFDGRKQEIVFTALSHRVYYEGRRESEQTEISYFLQKPNDNALPSLMKRESPFIDGKLYEGGPIYTIVENVIDLSFQYWDEKQQRWVDDWTSDDGQFRDRFPFAVKVHMVVGGPKEGQELTIDTQLKVAFPNNSPHLVKF